MIILGIDPGYGITGYGVVEFLNNHFRVIDYGVVSTDSKMLFSKRIEAIYDRIGEIIEKYHPDAAAIEELFFNNNITTAIAVAQGRGAALLSCTKHNVPTYEYTPLQVKQTVVGYGRAEKQQVQMMIKMILKLDKIPKPDDAADALGIAICHAHSMIGAEQI